MEKRLPLALFLSFLVLFGWQLLFPPPEKPKVEPDQISTVQPSESTGGAPTTTPEALPTPVGPVSPDLSLWREWVELGEEGQPGHYFVQFDNRGGRVSALKLGSYWVSNRLDDAERRELENRTTLLEEIPTTDTTLGSMLLRTGESEASRALARQPLEEALWEHEVLEDGVRFRLATGTGVVFTKTIRAVPGAYRLDVELEISNTNPELSGPKQFVFTPAAGVPRETTDSFSVEPTSIVAWSTEGEVSHDKEDRNFKGGEPKGSFGPSQGFLYAGVDNKYFAVMMRAVEDDPRAPSSMRSAQWRRAKDDTWAETHPDDADSAWRYMVTEILLTLTVPPPDAGAQSYRYTVFAGPKKRSVIEGDLLAHSAVIEKDLGFFASIASALLFFLGLLQGVFHNWGIAIIVLTLLVRAALFPINRRSQTAMARHQSKMKRIQPKLDEIKEKYKNNPQKLRQEQAKIMQEEGAFPPLGGCLPIFVQIPIFFGLFTALRTSFDLRQAGFMGWITDLSQPDRLARIDFDTHLPIIGTIEYLNVLPPLMVVLWVLQQKFMPKPADEQQARMQKMMMFMPIMFGFFLYNYAAGLSLYMITTSSLGIFEQAVIKKFWPVDDSEKPKKKSGFMQRLSELQAEAQKMQEQKRASQKGKPGGPKRSKKSAKR